MFVVRMGRWRCLFCGSTEGVHAVELRWTLALLCETYGAVDPQAFVETGLCAECANLDASTFFRRALLVVQRAGIWNDMLDEALHEQSPLVN